MIAKGIRAGCLCLFAVAASDATAQAMLEIGRADYANRLRAMWLGQCIANWTGLISEGRRIDPPFLTDADWGTTPAGFTAPLQFVLWQNPWLSDDDTDVEYIYLHLMAQAASPWLAPEQIRAGWREHMDPAYLWVSNHRAWELMGRGVRPPSTSLEGANLYCYHIDAQLTTEFFGAFAPAMPAQAIRLADLPIRTTASGHAAHASQFFALLYSLAPRVDPSLSGRDKALWLTSQAREWIPPTSKARAAIDLVVTDFLANPDAQNWERTRDLIYQHFQQNAWANGWAYRGWTESTVNFACGVMALLYGGCDYQRTVQIGTLSGWDSDNATATLGGLLGLMLGMDALRAQFPGWTFSDRYDIDRTRDNLPDYLPADPPAQDTFTLMAERMLPLIDQVVIAGGGTVDPANDRWVIPTTTPGDIPRLVPSWDQYLRSANNAVLAGGGQVTAASVPLPPPGPSGDRGSPSPSFLANGYEADFSGREFGGGDRFYFSTEGAPPSPQTTLTITYSRPIVVDRVRFIEGDHFSTGGWFDAAQVQLEINGAWAPAAAALSEPLDALRPFQAIDFVLAEPAIATGIRIVGTPGGAGAFVTCCELDAVFSPPRSNLSAPRGHP